MTLVVLSNRIYHKLFFHADSNNIFGCNKPRKCVALEDGQPWKVSKRATDTSTARMDYFQ